MAHLRDPRLLAGFGVGFCLLFAFIGIFTFVNFVLAGPSLGLGMMQIGYVCFVFLPSVFSTPLAGTAAARIGTRAALWGALAVAVVGLPLLLTSNLTVLIAGLVLVAVGTFAAQAIATGYVSRTAKTDRGAASGLYLASYFSGGLAGSIALGQIFQHAGWGACVAGVGGALLAAAAFTIGLRPVNQEQEIVT
jgi:MFS family permease